MKRIFNILPILILATAFIFLSCPDTGDGSPGDQTGGGDGSQVPQTGTVGVIQFNSATYTHNDTVEIYLTDIDLGDGASPSVSVVSESDTSGLSVNLSYSSANSRYEGSFQFRVSGSDDSKLLIAGDETLTASYSDALPVGSRTCSAEVTYFPSHVGVLSLDNSLYPLGGYATVSLVDADLSATTIDVQVVSETDTTGITVTLSDGNSDGTFDALIQIVTSVSDVNKIQCVDGGSFTVSYSDADPVATITAVGNVVKAAAVNIEETLIDVGDNLRLTLTDGDLAGGAGSAIGITLTTSSGQTLAVDLDWVSDHDFASDVLTTASAAIDKLLVVEGDLITLTYIDASPAVTVTDFCSVSSTGVLTFKDEKALLEEACWVYLVDADLPIETPVEVSVSVHGGGDSIELDLTWDASISKFANYFTPTEGAGSPQNPLTVLDGDVVDVVYEDDNPSGDVGESIEVFTHSVGTIKFGAEKYAPGDTVMVALIDGDLEEVATPTLSLDGGHDSFIVDLVWSSDDSSFNGTFTIALDTSQDLQVDYAGDITATYIDAAPVGVITKTIVVFDDAEISVIQPPSSDEVDFVELDTTFGYVIRMKDADLGAADTPSVTVSTISSNSISITLIKAGDYFVGNFFPISVGSTGDKNIVCAYTDNITITYDDPDLDDDATKVLSVDYLGKLIFDKKIYNNGDSWLISLDDKDLATSATPEVTITVAGVEITTPYEMAYNAGTKRFDLTLTLTESDPAPEGSITVATEGDSLSVKYEDSSPNKDVVNSFAKRSTTGKIGFGSPVYTIEAGKEGVLSITVTDPDPEADSSLPGYIDFIPVEVSSSTDTPEPFTIICNRASDTTFVGTVTATNNSMTPPGDKVYVVDGSVVTATYLDTDPAGSREGMTSITID